MTLLLLTGAAGMFVGAEGVPPLGLFAVTMVGLALACGGASALNHVLDRDLDRLMGRTGHRPVAEERVTPERAVEFGLALMAFSFVLLASLVNVLTAVLALVGGLFYVLVYTRWLKRTTPQNIVIGGAAGAVPPLVGWAAATGNLSLPALFLFLIVFFWTPPHFWALALVIKRDYAAARVPMLPVVRGDDETARQIVWYSLVLVAVTLLPFAWHTAGVAYLAVARAARRDLPALRVAAAARDDHRPRRRALPLLAPLPGAAVRRARRRPAALMAEHGPEFERENTRIGLALFGLFVVLVALTFAVALHLPRRLLSAPEGIFLARPEQPGEGIPLAVKDLFDTAGLVTTYGSILFADHVPRETAEAVRRLEAAGLRERRQDQPARVRLRHHLGERALRHGAEPALPRPHRGRLERRLGGGARGRARRRRARHRLRRLDPHPRRLLRRDRLQADLGARADRGLLPARAELRPRRPDGPRRRGLRADAAGARARVRARRGRARRRRGRRRLDRARRPARPRPGRGRGGALPTPSAARPAARGRLLRRFSREVADVHRELFAEHADSTARTSGPRSSGASPSPTPSTSGPASGGSVTASSWPRRPPASTWC